MRNGHGVIRVPDNQRCLNCSGSFKRVIVKSAFNIAYRCPKCLTVPARYYLDIHHSGERIRIFSDKQGKPLDVLNRAVDLLSHIRYEIENHIFDKTKYVRADLQKFLFENIITVWLNVKRKEGISIIYKYEQFNRDYFIFFKGHDVREIRTSHIHEFYHWLPERLINKTKKNILGALQVFFRWLLVMEHTEKMPVFPNIEINIPDWQWVDVEAQTKILLAIPTEDRYLYLFLSLHGCRPSEARALKIKDLDFVHNSINIRRTFSGKSGNILVEHTKTKKHRVIPINNPETISILKSLCRTRFGEDFVFINPRTCRPYAKTTYQEIWTDACKSVGIKIKSYEALRHSFASQRVSRGVDIYLISKVLGHTDIRTTQRYSHVNLEALKQIMDITTVSETSLDVNHVKK